MAIHICTEAERAQLLAQGLRPIPGFPNHLVSATGNVYTTVFKAPKLVKVCTRSGYKVAQLWRYGKNVNLPIHRAVCLAFYGPPTDKHHVRHLDGNRLNNNVDNLMWGTPAENYADQVRHGTVANGERHPSIRIPVETALKAIELAKTGYSSRTVGDELGISKTTVNELLSGKRRKSLPRERVIEE